MSVLLAIDNGPSVNIVFFCDISVLSHSGTTKIVEAVFRLIFLLIGFLIANECFFAYFTGSCPQMSNPKCALVLLLSSLNRRSVPALSFLCRLMKPSCFLAHSQSERLSPVERSLLYFFPHSDGEVFFILRIALAESLPDVIGPPDAPAVFAWSTESPAIWPSADFMNFSSCFGVMFTSFFHSLCIFFCSAVSLGGFLLSHSISSCQSGAGLVSESGLSHSISSHSGFFLMFRLSCRVVVILLLCSSTFLILSLNSLVVWFLSAIIVA